MAIIATLTQKNDGFEGTLTTLSITAPIALIPNAGKTKDNEPDYRIISRKNGFELGAGWSRASKSTGEIYISVTLSAPEFGTIYGNVVTAPGQDPTKKAIIWTPISGGSAEPTSHSRGRRSSAPTGARSTPTPSGSIENILVDSERLVGSCAIASTAMVAINQRGSSLRQRRYARERPAQEAGAVLGPSRRAVRRAPPPCCRMFDHSPHRFCSGGVGPPRPVDACEVALSSSTRRVVGFSQGRRAACRCRRNCGEGCIGGALPLCRPRPMTSRPDRHPGLMRALLLLKSRPLRRQGVDADLHPAFADRGHDLGGGEPTLLHRVDLRLHPANDIANAQASSVRLTREIGAQLLEGHIDVAGQIPARSTALTHGVCLRLRLTTIRIPLSE
jgi:uncharacterized protein (DUF736 family)